MKGYFHQLAKQTGLSFERGAARDKPQKVLRDSRKPSPLEIDQVVFTEASRENSTPVEGSMLGETREPVRRLNLSESQRALAPETTVPTDDQVASATESPVSDIAPVASEPRVFDSSKLTEPRAVGSSIDNKRANASPPLEEIGLEESTPLVEIANPEWRAQSEQLLERIVTETPTRPQHEIAVREYLREVMAWVSATPEGEPDQPQRTSLPPRIEVFELHSEIERPGNTTTVEPLAQDLNLSIGNISIVIEEPTPPATAQVTAPARPERAPERTMTEPTRLSRYYLRSW
jgi:hypothetical protein